MFDYFDVYKTENLLCSALTGPDPESGYFLPEPLWPWKENSRWKIWVFKVFAAPISLIPALTYPTPTCTNPNPKCHYYTDLKIKGTLRGWVYLFSDSMTLSASFNLLFSSPISFTCSCRAAYGSHHQPLVLKKMSDEERNLDYMRLDLSGACWCSHLKSSLATTRFFWKGYNQRSSRHFKQLQKTFWKLSSDFPNFLFKNNFIQRQALLDAGHNI